MPRVLLLLVLVLALPAALVRGGSSPRFGWSVGTWKCCHMEIESELQVICMWQLLVICMWQLFVSFLL